MTMIPFQIRPESDQSAPEELFKPGIDVNATIKPPEISAFRKRSGPSFRVRNIVSHSTDADRKEVIVDKRRSCGTIDESIVSISI